MSKTVLFTDISSLIPPPGALAPNTLVGKVTARLDGLIQSYVNHHALARY